MFLCRLIINEPRKHRAVQPERFDSATILFSDIPVFTEIISRCSLMEIIGFLNNVHSAFDQIVRQFNVYKVETINESYVVCPFATTELDQRKDLMTTVLFLL